jgi:ABC-type polysaccharide/polyol phosphate export permease
MWTSSRVVPWAAPGNSAPTISSTRQYLHLVRQLVLAQLRLRDQSTLLGFTWSFLHPLLMLLLLYLFFNHEAGREIEHYPVFLLIGLVHYNHFSNSTTAAANVLTGMGAVTRETIFPKALMVLASVIATSVEFAISMLLCLVIAFVAGVPIQPTVTLLPLVMLMQGWTVLWVSLLLACMLVFARDVGHLYQIFLRMLFFITPIFYGVEFLGNGLARYVVLASPLAAFVGWSRSLILGGQPFEIGPFLAVGAVNLLATLGSLLVFRRCEPSFSERL